MMLSEALQQRTTKASLYICPVAGADTIACLTGYPQDMCSEPTPQLTAGACFYCEYTLNVVFNSVFLLFFSYF